MRIWLILRQQDLNTEPVSAVTKMMRQHCMKWSVQQTQCVNYNMKEAKKTAKIYINTTWKIKNITLLILSMPIRLCTKLREGFFLASPNPNLHTQTQYNPTYHVKAMILHIYSHSFGFTYELQYLYDFSISSI